MTDQKNFGIIKAYVVPHPPIVLPEIGQGRESEIQDTLDSMKTVAKEIAEIAPDTIVLTTPHAPLYRDAFFVSLADRDSGNLADFGFPQVGETLDNDLALAELVLKKSANQDVALVKDQAETNSLDHGSLVPLRFICAEYQDFKLLRLGLSGLSAKTHYRLGQIINEALVELDRRAVFVASGDLSHVLKSDGPYGYRKEGPEFDRKVTDILARAAFDELLAMPEELTEPAAQCGLPSFWIMAGSLDGRDVTAELLSYQGNFGVGYGVLTFDPRTDNPQRRFNAEKNKNNPYVNLARQTIEEFIKDGVVSKLDSDLPDELLKRKAATFVTLHRNGKLRGCIGTLEPYADSLATEIQQNAISAATKDPRFPPLREEELADLEVSVDVLSEPEAIESFADLDPLRYGVIVSKGRNRGVLLPDLEGVDTAEKQVEIALSKAGIGQAENYKLERFEVIRHE